jgi:dUTP pyrophosphatase
VLNDFYLKIQVLVPGAKPFQPGEDEDAGYDIWAINTVTIPALSSAVIRTGIATEFPVGYVGLMLDRSSMGFKGGMRRAGVIDSGYRDEWRVCLFNSSSTPIMVESILDNSYAKAIAQVVFVPYFKVKPELVFGLSESKRGTKGYGSSDASVAAN